MDGERTEELSGRMGGQSLARVGPWAIAFTIVLTGCATGQEQAAPPGRAEMVQGFIELGLTEPVATCVVGWTEQLDLLPADPLLSRQPSDQLIVDEAVENCAVAAALVNPAPAAPELLAFDDQPNTFGDDPQLDQLWTQCDEGNGEACDALWQTAPIGSAYEQFGVTCGQRLEILDCGTELNSVEDLDS